MGTHTCRTKSPRVKDAQRQNRERRPQAEPLTHECVSTGPSGTLAPGLASGPPSTGLTAPPHTLPGNTARSLGPERAPRRGALPGRDLTQTVISKGAWRQPGHVATGLRGWFQTHWVCRGAPAGAAACSRLGTKGGVYLQAGELRPRRWARAGDSEPGRGTTSLQGNGRRGQTGCRVTRSSMQLIAPSPGPHLLCHERASPTVHLGAILPIFFHLRKQLCPAL